MSSYNYEQFTTNDYDFDRFGGPKVGEKAPDFECTTTENRSKRILDFDGDFLVLELGSITCPLFQGRRAGMSSLHQLFPNVSSAILYVREAHPGIDIPSHRSFEEKQQRAQMLKNDDGEERLILVDGLDGAAHKAYGGLPNAVYIINANGCVVYRSKWNNANATKQALAALTKGKAPDAKGYFLPASPAVVVKTLKRSGDGSLTDFLVGLPKLIWVNLIKRNLSLFLNRKPDTAANFADLTC